MTEARGTDRYQLTTRIATGGMGEVWRAQDTLLDREVAVKVLKHEYADDPVFRSRFANEARHAAGLNHPNIASVFDVGELPPENGSGVGRPFLVMELVPGKPLSALIRHGEPMPPDRATDLVTQAADGLAAAHAAGMVHRDVKPGNLLVTPDGRVKITDFGIARMADSATMTQTGQVIGTPHYLAPEQAEGKSATPATDVYSLGVVLYECLAGHRPFDRETAIQVALAHLREPVPPLPPEVPAGLRAIVDKALAKKPADRFASAADLADALRAGTVPEADEGATAVIGGAGVAAAAAGDETQVDTGPATPAQPLAADEIGAGDEAGKRRGERRGWRRWWPWLAAAAVILIAIAGAAALLGDGSDEGGSAAANGPDAETVLVRADDYIGRDADRVRKELERKGLEVREEGRPARGGQEPGTVADLAPTGRVERGSTITLQVWRPVETDGGSQPQAPPAQEPDDQGDRGPGQGEDRRPGPQDKRDQRDTGETREPRPTPTPEPTPTEDSDDEPSPTPTPEPTPTEPTDDATPSVEGEVQ